MFFQIKSLKNDFCYFINLICNICVAFTSVFLLAHCVSSSRARWNKRCTLRLLLYLHEYRSVFWVLSRDLKTRFQYRPSFEDRQYKELSGIASGPASPISLYFFFRLLFVLFSSHFQFYSSIRCSQSEFVFSVKCWTIIL